MTIRIPDDVKKAFEGEDKDAVIASLLERAALDKRIATVEAGQKRLNATSWPNFASGGSSRDD